MPGQLSVLPSHMPGGSASPEPAVHEEAKGKKLSGYDGHEEKMN